MASSTWKAALYARISHEDEALGESDSITGQKRFLEDWAARRGDVEVVTCYADDGWSGANFERPGFERMLADARTGLFDTIVVKDLSRFGRSYLDCGRLIERELPKLGVRLYSVTDDFDSAREWDYNTAIVFPIKNLINEMHVITTSEKVRTSLAAKRERGECTANFAPYGYAKDPNDRHRLVVDEPAAEVVRAIFRWRLDGTSASEIARKLDRNGVPCPSEYKRQQGLRYYNGLQHAETPRWHVQTVMRILRNEAYTGTLVQGKRRRPSWRTGTALPVEPERWQRTANAHEPIVTSEEFQKVKTLLA